MKQIFILLILLPEFCVGQDFGLDNLTNFKWTSEKEITDFNIGQLKEIGLSKLKVSIDSIKKDVSIWEFNNDKLKIINYKFGQGMDSLVVNCSYSFNQDKRTIRIFHFTQDSSFWEYSIAIVSTGSYILLTRKK